jgi:hypothetical protein
VRAACLYVATKLGELIDETVIIGGLAPSLLIDQPRIQSAEDRHVGTMDLDGGLALAIFDNQHYQDLTDVCARRVSRGMRTNGDNPRTSAGVSTAMQRSPWTS